MIVFSDIDYLILPVDYLSSKEAGKTKAQNMTIKYYRRWKLITALAVLGLTTAIAAPNANAFSDSDFSGRLVCMIGQDFNSITGVVKYTPDGTGHYIKGTLVAAVTSFPGGTFNAASPKSDFCNYTLDTALSGYTINLNGTGTETLTWDSVAGNAAACPEEPSFNDQTAIAINGSDSRVEITSANFLNQNVAATGNCTP